MALDDTREALALRDARDIDFLPDGKDLDAHRTPHLHVGELLGSNAELLEDMPRLDGGLGKMPGSGLVHAVRAALAERDLHRGVAVGVR